METVKDLKDFIKESLKQKSFYKKMIVANLNFVGYFSEAPDVEKDGLYAAFARNKENPQAPAAYHLVYIGIGNIKIRISDHIRDDHQKWAKKGCYIPSKEEIVYSYALFSYDKGLSEIEKVMVNQAKPCYNTVYKDEFDSDCLSIHIECKGNKGCLKDRYNWTNPQWYGEKNDK